MNQATRIVAGGVIIWLGLFMCSDAYKSLAQPTYAKPPNAPPGIEVIRELAELAVLKVEATEVITGRVKGRVGGTSVIVLVRGDVMIGVDLEKAKFLKIDEDQHHLILSLPPPTVRRVVIDHHVSRTIHCQRDGIWNMAIGPAAEDKAIADAFMRGTERLKEVAAHKEMIQRAKRHAEFVLGRFTNEAGWSLEVRWE